MRDLGRFDYVVVGAGTAGCVLANRLSADPQMRVLLLEAGGKDNYFWIHVPVGYLYCMGNPRTDWGYRTVADAGLNGRAINYPRGRVLGGCSSINGMIYMRGQARDYDMWRQSGLTGWGWDDVLPYFVKSEDHFQGLSQFHGAEGGLRVEQQRLHWDILDVFRNAAADAGIAKVEDFNCGDNSGSSYFQVNQKKGLRWNAAKAFLDPVRGRKNLEIVTGAQATGLETGNGRVTAVKLKIGTKDAVAHCDGEIVLSTGAIGTPQLLELSGIGRPEFLREAGIEARIAVPELGENLQDHLQLRMIFKVANALTLNKKASTLAGKAAIALEYLMKRTGPMSMAPSQLGAFAKSDPSRDTPNLEYHVQPLSLDKFGDPLHGFDAITASVCNLRPDSRGSVHIRAADPGAHPAIRPNYLSTESDRKVAVDAIRLTRRIMAGPAFDPHQPEEYLPGAGIDDDQGLARAAGDIGTTIFHPVGTARMGADSGAVVDERLRMTKLAGLRIADASVMPAITSGNTNAPVTMIAEKCADMMRQDRRA